MSADNVSPAVVVSFYGDDSGNLFRGTLLSPASVAEDGSLHVEGSSNVSVVCEYVDTRDFVAFSVPVSKVHGLTLAQAGK